MEKFCVQLHDDFGLVLYEIPRILFVSLQIIPMPIFYCITKPERTLDLEKKNLTGFITVES